MLPPPSRPQDRYQNVCSEYESEHAFHAIEGVTIFAPLLTSFYMIFWIKACAALTHPTPLPQQSSSPRLVPCRADHSPLSLAARHRSVVITPDAHVNQLLVSAILILGGVLFSLLLL